MKKILACAVGIFSCIAFAQTPAPAPVPTKAEPEKKAAMAEAPPMPKLPAEGRKWIDMNRGNWNSNDVVMTMGDQVMKGKMSMRCEAASNNWATLCHAKFNLGKSMPPSNATFLYAWNIGSNEATMFEVSDMAEVHTHTGKWTDDKTITITHSGNTADGKYEVDALTFTWTSPKEVMIKAQGTQGGNVMWSMTATAKK